MPLSNALKCSLELSLYPEKKQEMGDRLHAFADLHKGDGKAQVVVYADGDLTTAGRYFIVADDPAPM